MYMCILCKSHGTQRPAKLERQTYTTNRLIPQWHPNVWRGAALRASAAAAAADLIWVWHSHAMEGSCLIQSMGHCTFLTGSIPT
jgi:hypothetical protein